MAEFQNSLSYELWDQVFDGDDVNKNLTLFEHLLKDFLCQYPTKKINNETNDTLDNDRN